MGTPSVYYGGFEKDKMLRDAVVKVFGKDSENGISLFIHNGKVCDYVAGGSTGNHGALERAWNRVFRGHSRSESSRREN